jgi:hypothetical protein
LTARGGSAHSGSGTATSSVADHGARL